MTNAEERKQKAVAIAKDVLKQLRRCKCKYKPRSSFKYIAAKLGVSRLTNGFESNDLQPYVDDIQAADCEVCALGAAVLSKARLYDEVHVDSVLHEVSRNDIHQILIDVFTDENMDLIESAFECRFVSMNYNNSFQKAVEFGAKYSQDEARLKGIMRNIIDNEGVFKP